MISCLNCKYWVRHGDQEGACHRAAPTIVLAALFAASDEIVRRKFFHEGKLPAEAIWPMTFADDVCGQGEAVPAAATRTPPRPPRGIPLPKSDEEKIEAVRRKFGPHPFNALPREKRKARK